jgi:hypothetical protein
MTPGGKERRWLYLIGIRSYAFGAVELAPIGPTSNTLQAL